MDDVGLGHLIRSVERDGGERDEVAVEEPLEIRVDGEPLAVTMRTPGHDEELALGFLLGEGLIDRAHDAGPTADLAGNVVEVAGPLLRDAGARRFYTSSSCGVCGKGALEEVAVHAAPARAGPGRAARAARRAARAPARRAAGVRAHRWPARDRAVRRRRATLLAVREDVGRHNAMDKVIGRALLDGRVPLARATSCASAAGSRSSSCRRPRSRAARSSSASAPRRRWRSRSRASSG